MATNQKRFTFSMPIMKAYIEEGTNKRILEGVASTTDRDLHGDKMAPEAIKSMADSLRELKKKDGTLNAEHDKSWQSEIGDVVGLEATKGNKLVMKAELNETSKANDLWYLLTEKRKKLGLSIGGFVKRYRIEVDEKTKEYMRVFENIVLDHIAVVSQPANPNTWVGAIAKSVNGIQLGALQETEEELNNKLSNDEVMAKDIKKVDAELEKSSEETVEETVEETTDETAATEEETTEAEAENAEEATVVEEATTEEVSEGESKEEDSTESEEEASEDSAEEAESEEEAVDGDGEESTTEEAEEDKPEEEEKGFASKDEVEALKSFVESGFKEIKELLTATKSEVVATEKSEGEAEEDEAEGDEEISEQENVEVKSLREEISNLTKVVAGLEKTNSNRKTVEIEKFEGEEEEVDTLDEKLEKAKKEFAKDPNLFAILGKIRKEYKSKK